MAKSRLIGDYPVIGIRPIIDATERPSEGVRQSLEEQTMGMALAAKKLFEENIRYSNGEPVKVVISDTTIGRVAEAAACAAQFKKEGVDITLSVTPCWCYGSETMDMDPQHHQGRLGLQRHRAPRRGVSGMRAGNACAEGSAGIRHLRHATCRTPTTPPFPRM